MTDGTVADHPPGAGRRAAAVQRIVALFLVLVLSACTTVLTRSAVPPAQIDDAAPYGIPSRVVRDWGDTLSPEKRDAILKNWTAKLRVARAEEIAAGRPIREVSLALSGGGPDGAFGAGLLNGWTARGDRPEFTIVTGISTGAIIALFAFLGPDHDGTLTEIYTTFSTEHLATPAFFSALTGGTAIADTSGYRRLIERYVDEAIVARLAEEHRQGRVLLIGTTNLDAARPVVWNVSRIAATGHPQARTLIHDIIQASSAIPGAFPPVLIPVETPDGRRHDEMHVDGGATQQVMLFSPQFQMKAVDQELGARVDRSLYVVMNNTLAKPYQPVPPRVLSIAGAAISSLLGGSGTGDIYKLHAIAERDGIDLKVVWIPREFDRQPSEPFDPVYMKALYEVGYRYGLAGDRWQAYPPDFAPAPRSDRSGGAGGSRPARLPSSAPAAAAVR